MAWKNVIEFEGYVSLSNRQVSEIYELGYYFDAQKWLTEEGYIRNVTVYEFELPQRATLQFSAFAELDEEQVQELKKSGCTEDMLENGGFLSNVTIEEYRLVERFEEPKPPESGQEPCDNTQEDKEIQQRLSAGRATKPGRRIYIREIAKKQEDSPASSGRNEPSEARKEKDQYPTFDDSDAVSYAFWHDIPSHPYCEPLLGDEAGIPTFDPKDLGLLQELGEKSGYWQSAYDFVNHLEELLYELHNNLSDKQYDWLYKIREDLDLEWRRREK